jgi:hypothetical protein
MINKVLKKYYSLNIKFLFDILLIVILHAVYYFIMDLTLFKYKLWNYYLWIGIELFFSILIFYIAYKRCKRRELLKNENKLSILYSLFLSFLYCGFILFLFSLLRKFGGYLNVYDVSESVKKYNFNPNNFAFIIDGINAFTFSVLLEEYVFRGYFYNSLKKWMPISIAMLIQAFIFTIIHNKNIFEMSLIFIMGMVFAVVYEIHKDIKIPILTHSFYNFSIAFLLILGVLYNSYTPAKTWEEANSNPKWFSRVTVDIPEDQNNPIKYYNYVKNKWGYKGNGLWKRVILAYEQLIEKYPENREICAKAQADIADIYATYLYDFRRAILKSEYVLKEYPEFKEECANALITKGYSYFYLKEYDKSREAAELVLFEYSENKEAVEGAKKGLHWVENRNRIVDTEIFGIKIKI